MLIAVPGWPLPTFWTASIARTRRVSIARRSSSPKPSGRVGFGWDGLPVGASVAASAGASDPVLCGMWGLLPRDRLCVVNRAFSRAVVDRGRTVVVDVALPAADAAST